jgi:tetratricopeptide (TPR) repeat protein
LREFDEAEKYYKKMLTNFPNNVDASVSLGMLYLTQKKFTQGYEYFYKRELPKIVRDVKNIWKPNDIINDNVTILCEQGIGDQIQFARYLPFLKSKTITIAMKKSLQRLMKENFPSLNIIDYSEINKDEQMIRITDLAFALNIDFDNIPSSKGYLDCQEMNIESDKPKIGLCWEAGSAGIRTLINRTINVKAFEPIFDLANIQLYSLQYIDTLGGNEKYPQMINLAKDFNDFYDTASAIKSMDAIITVDTSIAHIAGALGKKTYLLLPYTSDWRWFDDTKTTPWYDSIEIFKQKDNISWEKEIMEITKILKKY